VGTLSEALLAVACALAADDTVHSDQRRHESALVYRLLRDVGLGGLAAPLAAPGTACGVPTWPPCPHAGREPAPSGRG
jgi:hypothetical protein